MATRTPHLSTETIDELRDLVRINVESAKGFAEAAGLLDNLTFSEAFRGLADQRRLQANELAGYVESGDGGLGSERKGSFLVAFRRAWVNVRTALANDDTATVLAEFEAGEDRINEAYEQALDATTGSPVNDVLTRQYADVKAAHERIRDLRDAARER